jgi:hypothetical protein
MDKNIIIKLHYWWYIWICSYVVTLATSIAFVAVSVIHYCTNTHTLSIRNISLCHDSNQMVEIFDLVVGNPSHLIYIKKKEITSQVLQRKRGVTDLVVRVFT